MIDHIAMTKGGTKYWLDGKEVDEATYRERYPLPKSGGGAPRGAKASSYPYAADSLGVHPDQRQEAMEDAASRGVPTRFTEDGSIVWESRQHQKQYCQAYGYVNKDENWSGRK